MFNEEFIKANKDVPRSSLSPIPKEILNRVSHIPFSPCSIAEVGMRVKVNYNKEGYLYTGEEDKDIYIYIYIYW